MKKIILISFLSLITCAVTLVNAQSSTNTLQRYMEQLRIKTYEPLPTSIFLDKRNEAKLVNTIIPFLSDTSERVRENAYYILAKLGQKSENQSVRELAVENLVIGVRDHNTGISGNASSALSKFKKEDFSNVAADSIAKFIDLKTPHLTNVIKLSGYLEIENAKEKLRGLLFSNTTVSNKWACRIALARMGDPDALDYIVKKLNTAIVNDDFVYDIIPDLIYTRQKDVFVFLEDVIKSDKPSCESANPDSNEKILCCYRVMEYLAPVIIGSPLKVDKNGDLDEADYQEALTKLRGWLSVNRNYTIDNNSF